MRTPLEAHRVLTGRLPDYGPYYNISLRAASGKFDLQPEHDSCCSHVASARALDFCFTYECEVLITAPDASPQPNYLENIAPLPYSPARRRCAGAPTCGAEQVDDWMDASRCATSIAHLPVSVRSAEGKEAKSSQGWASSTKRCHHLQQGRRGERAARQGVPPGGGVVTPPHRTTRSARAAALLLCKRRRTDSRASERLTARSIPSAAAAQAGGEGGAASCVDGVRG